MTEPLKFRTKKVAATFNRLLLIAITIHVFADSGRFAGFAIVGLAFFFAMAMEYHSYMRAEVPPPSPPVDT